MSYPILGLEQTNFQKWERIYFYTTNYCLKSVSGWILSKTCYAGTILLKLRTKYNFKNLEKEKIYVQKRFSTSNQNISVINSYLYEISNLQRTKQLKNYLSIIIIAFYLFLLFSFALIKKINHFLKCTYNNIFFYFLFFYFIRIFSVFFIFYFIRIFSVSGSKLGIFVSSICSMVALRCIIALFYELLMEINYPAPESLVTLVWGQVQKTLE